MKDLVPSIRKTAELVQEVATASREQAAGVAQVTNAITQMDQVTQRNAAAAEELSGTAEQMANQATILQQLLSAFRIDNAPGKKPAQADPYAAAITRRRSGQANSPASATQPSPTRLLPTAIGDAAQATDD